MIAQREFIILLVGTFLASFATRYLPLVFLAKKDLSSEFKEWMNFIPVTIFAALVAADIFFIDNTFSLNIFENQLLIPSALVLLVSLKTKSLIYALLFGIGSLFILQLI